MKSEAASGRPVTALFRPAPPRPRPPLTPMTFGVKVGAPARSHFPLQSGCRKRALQHPPFLPPGTALRLEGIGPTNQRLPPPTHCPLWGLLGFLRPPPLPGAVCRTNTASLCPQPGPLGLRALLLKWELGAAGPAPVGVREQLVGPVPASRPRPVLAGRPGGGPHSEPRTPGPYRLLLVQTSSRVWKQDVFGNLALPPPCQTGTPPREGCVTLES